MLLKSLEIQGFKTFPEKTVLTFHDGITAVVGPNGSGKTSFCEALEFSLLGYSITWTGCNCIIIQSWMHIYKLIGHFEIGSSIQQKIYR